jgi:hypothetical protein
VLHNQEKTARALASTSKAKKLRHQFVHTLD